MTSTERSGRPARAWRLARVAIAQVQEYVAVALGVSRARRTETVIDMLDANARRAPGYWLQLFLATGIATLGLALGSTAVVIGGMLVSPLMGPVVELGMGFAVGSSLLVIRAFIRVALSVTSVVAAAALITLALPFHALTAEIAARTAPTLLDLLIAVFCALAAAYTTVRQTADTTAAAAGTAIGIALVPPLCVVGYGIGTAAADIAGGAALLFTANFSAIVLVAVVSFFTLGYNQVEAATLEHDYLEAGGTRTDRAATRTQLVLRQAFGSRYGMATRLLVPAVVLGAVALPLSRALDEVAWEFRVRDGIQRILASESSGALQSAVNVDRNSVALRLLILGSPETAADLQQRLSVRIASLAGVTPSVTVSAVPDATVLAATRSAETRDADRLTSAASMAAVTSQVGTSLLAAWPGAAGRLLDWSIELSMRETPQVTVRHLGAPLGRAAEEMLARSVSLSLRSSVRIVDIALPVEASVAAEPRDSVWLASALTVLDAIADVDSTIACVDGPAASLTSRRRGSAAMDEVEAKIRGSRGARAGKLTLSRGTKWSIRVAQGTCDTSATSGS